MARAHLAAGWGGRRLQRARRYAMRHLGWTCWLCGHDIASPDDYSIDHVVPISKDMARAWDVTNWRPAHRRAHADLGCVGNSGRGSRDAKHPPLSRAW